MVVEILSLPLSRPIASFIVPGVSPSGADLSSDKTTLFVADHYQMLFISLKIDGLA